jgi:hypothetical protein
MTLEGVHYKKIWSNFGRSTLVRNSGVTIGWTACEASSETWNLATNLVFALGLRKTTETLDRVGIKYASPNVTPYLCRCFIGKRSLHIDFTYFG